MCGICGGSVPEEDVHIDHILPVLLGGRNYDNNLRVTHSVCNLRRPKRPTELLQ
jgi:5-methylcytosine-specific restriction endonuclease McrA